MSREFEFSFEKAREVTKEQLLEEAAHVQGMMGTMGWSIIEKEARERINNLGNLLIWENDSERKSDLQANIRSLVFLLRFPLDMLEAARRVNESDRENPDSGSNEEPPA